MELRTTSLHVAVLRIEYADEYTPVVQIVLTHSRIFIYYFVVRACSDVPYEGWTGCLMYARMRVVTRDGPAASDVCAHARSGEGWTGYLVNAHTRVAAIVVLYTPKYLFTTSYVRVHTYARVLPSRTPTTSCVRACS